MLSSCKHWIYSYITYKYTYQIQTHFSTGWSLQLNSNLFSLLIFFFNFDYSDPQTVQISPCFSFSSLLAFLYWSRMKTWQMSNTSIFITIVVLVAFKMIHIVLWSTHAIKCYVSSEVQTFVLKYAVTHFQTSVSLSKALKTSNIHGNTQLIRVVRSYFCLNEMKSES